MRRRAAPLALPRLVCSGWYRDRTKTARVHDEVRVLREGPGPASHGICRECRLAFVATIPATKETPCSPVTTER